MIPESIQDQAALYVLRQLGAEEKGAFERELAGDGELRALVAELHAAASVLVAAEGEAAPPAGLRGRVLARVAEEGSKSSTAADDPSEGKVVEGPWARTWIPWTLAACLAICCGWLASSRARLRNEIAEAKAQATFQMALAKERQQSTDGDRNTPALRDVIYCPLQPVKDVAVPQTAVLWDAAKGEGEIHVNHLAHPREGQDYQLWVVEEGKKDPVSAGVVKLDAAGNATAPFRPVEAGKAVAFAVSIEREGGVPKSEGQIVFLGKL